MLNISFTPNAWEDYLYWQRTDRKLLKKINILIKDVQRNPDGTGLGKAEKLSHELSGFCSRRINYTHRMIYKVEKNMLIIFQLRFHYKE